jgi:hypothetical protein
MAVTKMRFEAVPLFPALVWALVDRVAGETMNSQISSIDTRKKDTSA